MAKHATIQDLKKWAREFEEGINWCKANGKPQTARYLMSHIYALDGHQLDFDCASDNAYFTALKNKLKRNGVLRSGPAAFGSAYNEYTVSGEFLDLTGVQHELPTSKQPAQPAQPAQPVILPPAVDLEKEQAQMRDKLLAELKALEVDSATARTLYGGSISFESVSLYTLYESLTALATDTQRRQDHLRTGALALIEEDKQSLQAEGKSDEPAEETTSNDAPF